MLVPHYLNYSDYIMYFNIQEERLPFVFLIFQNFAVLFNTFFQISFRIISSVKTNENEMKRKNCTPKPVGVLIRIMLN